MMGNVSFTGKTKFMGLGVTIFGATYCLWALLRLYLSIDCAINPGYECYYIAPPPEIAVFVLCKSIFVLLSGIFILKGKRWAWAMAGLSLTLMVAPLIFVPLIPFIGVFVYKALSTKEKNAS